MKNATILKFQMEKWKDIKYAKNNETSRMQSFYLVFILH